MDTQKIQQLKNANPLLSEMASYQEVFWLNPQSGQTRQLPFTEKTLTMPKPDFCASLRILPKPFLKLPLPAVLSNPSWLRFLR